MQTPPTLVAEATLLVLANELDRTHPWLAASLREGLDESSRCCDLASRPTIGADAALDECH